MCTSTHARTGKHAQQAEVITQRNPIDAWQPQAATQGGAFDGEGTDKHHSKTADPQRSMRGKPIHMHDAQFRRAQRMHAGSMPRK